MLLSDLVTHLRSYGYQHFDSDAYWEWAGQKLGKHAEKVDRLRERCADGVATPTRLREFTDYVAAPALAGIVASQQTDDIAQAMQAVTRAVVGRQRILDLGCGVGSTATWLARVGGPDRRVVGIDFSTKAIASAAQSAKRLGVTNVEFWGRDFDRDLRPELFDAVVDMAAAQYARNVGALFRRVRETLADDGIVVSVPMLGRVREIEAFLETLADADLRLRSFEWVFARDLGRNMARPALVLDRTGEAIQVDVRREMDAAKSRLGGTRITPLFELAKSEPGMMV